MNSKAYGLKLFAGTFLENANIEGGVVFPEVDTTPGQIFFRTDQNKLYVRNNFNDTWLPIGSGTGGITDNGDGTYTIVDSDDNVTIIDTRAHSDPYSPINAAKLTSTNLQDAVDEISLSYLDKVDAEANYLQLAGGTMSGKLDMGDNVIREVHDPIDETDAVNKRYLDSNLLNGQPMEDHSNLVVPPFKSDGDIISWNSSLNSWIVSAGSAGSFVELSDTPSSMSLPDAGSFIRVALSGTTLEYHTMRLNDMSDVNTSNAKNNQVLTYSAGNDQWIPKPVPAVVEVVSGIITTTTPGSSAAYEDLNIMDWSGHMYSDEDTPSALYIGDGQVWLFNHDGVAYIWDGPSEVTVGVGGEYNAEQSDLIKTGSNNNWVMANNGVDFPSAPTAPTGSIAIGDGAAADVVSNRILLRTPDAGLRVTRLGAIETTSDGGVSWVENDATAILKKTQKSFTNNVGETLFQFNHNYGFLEVFYNGIRLIEDIGYTDISSNAFSLTDPVVDDEDIIYAVSYDVE